MSRLRKADVEALWDGYDRDPAGALAVALGRVLDRPGLALDELVAVAELGTDRSRALLARDQSAMDDLARELNELRCLDGR